MSLHTLDLSSNGLDAGGVRVLAAALPQSISLRKLSLADNRLGATSASLLGKALLRTRLADLDLSRMSLASVCACVWPARKRRCSRSSLVRAACQATIWAIAAR